MVASDLANGADSSVDSGRELGDLAGGDGPSSVDATVDAAGSDAGGGCVIGGTHYAADEVNPGDLCQVCQPAQSSTQWTTLADGAACAAGRVCVTGSCVAACHIGASWYVADYLNPSNSCQSCQPAKSTSLWSNLADDTACGAGKTCYRGACLGGCSIGGMTYTAGTTNPGNPCESCQPGVDPNGWTTTNGASCGSGLVCQGSQCISGCFISGAVYPAGATQVSSNLCSAYCNPSQSTTAWTVHSNGDGCKIVINALTNHEGVCYLGTCHDGCYIAATFWTNGATQPGNACQECITPSWFPTAAEPPPSTTWAALDGSACGTNMRCVRGNCQ